MTTNDNTRPDRIDEMMDQLAGFIEEKAVQRQSSQWRKSIDRRRGPTVDNAVGSGSIIRHDISNRAMSPA